MTYTKEDVAEFIQMEDVKFIRLGFCDFYGNLKNIAIMPEKLSEAFEQGISIDGSAVRGFASPDYSDLFLVPIASTFTVLPWRSMTGKVVRMFCEIHNPDGSFFERDSRYILSKAISVAKDAGINVEIASETQFYLFKNDEHGNSTKTPYDNAGYLDVSPSDKGEDVRRDICLTLKAMDIQPEKSLHEEGPGQNEIDICPSSPMKSADDVLNLIAVVKDTAVRNGLTADFSPKPLSGKSGNGFHINISVKADSGEYVLPKFGAGILAHIREMTAFLNPVHNSYERIGSDKAPKYIGWGAQNRTQLIRVPAGNDSDSKRIELRSPDPCANPYIAFALLIYAGLDGIKNNTELPPPVQMNMYTAPSEITSKMDKLPESLGEAIELARQSEFIKSVLPEAVLDALTSSF